jgi:ATP-binding cassette, subfamily B (MDR/TAP), member 1
MMSLLFGNLTQDFVEFGVVLNEAQLGIPGAAEQIPAAAAHFRHVAALDASFLVLIGNPHQLPV